MAIIETQKESPHSDEALMGALRVGLIACIVSTCGLMAALIVCGGGA